MTEEMMLTCRGTGNDPPSLNAKELREYGVVCPLLRGVVPFVYDQTLPADL